MGEDSDKKKEKKSKKKDKEEAPAEDAGDAPKPEAKKATKAPSNVFALFNQAQIQEFKEAFQMMDLDRDGHLSASDLAGIWQQTGREPESKVIDEMIAESPGQLNFTHFLNLFGEKMHGTDPEQTLKNAFAMFDSDKSGMIDEAYVKELLTTVGDQFSKEEIKMTWKEAPIEGGKLDYVKFVQFIKRGKEEEA